MLAEELGSFFRHLLDIVQGGDSAERQVNCLCVGKPVEDGSDALDEVFCVIQASSRQVIEMLQHGHFRLGVVAAAPVALDVQQEVGVVLAVALHLDNGATEAS